MTPESFIVKRRLKETSDTFTIELGRAAGPFPFEPGQFNMLYAFGVGEVPIPSAENLSRPTRWCIPFGTSVR